MPKYTTQNEIRRKETTPVVYLLTVGQKKWYRKNDERQNKACQKSKNDKASRCCWSA